LPKLSVAQLKKTINAKMGGLNTKSNVSSVKEKFLKKADKLGFRGSKSKQNSKLSFLTRLFTRSENIAAKNDTRVQANGLTTPTTKRAITQPPKNESSIDDHEMKKMKIKKLQELLENADLDHHPICCSL
jgi:hypothetical protein